MSTPAERVQRFLDNYEGTEIITSTRRQPPGCACPVPLRLSDLRSILDDQALAALDPIPVADAKLLFAAIERHVNDTGERMDLDDLATEFGFTREQLEGE